MFDSITLDVNEKTPPATEPEAQGKKQLSSQFSPPGPAPTSKENGPGPQPDYGKTIEFLSGFHPNRRWLLTAITLELPKTTTTKTFDASREQACRKWLEAQGATKNLYFSVGEPACDLQKKAERKEIANVWWLHVDVDPRVGEPLEEEHARIRKLVQAPPDLPPPSVIVFSGGGYQAFWKLREPIPIDCDLTKAEDAKLYNLQIERLLKADNVHDITHIMRLPGSLNRPDAKKLAKGRKLALAEVVEWHDDRVYALGKFQKAAISSAGSKNPTVQVDARKVTRFELSDPVFGKVPGSVKEIINRGYDPDNPKKFGDPADRSRWLFLAVCGMVRAGLDDQTIFSIITNSGFSISESVLDKGSKRHDYAIRQIEKARQAVAKDGVSEDRSELQELNSRHFVIGNFGGKCRVFEEVQDHALGNRVRLTRQSFDDFRNRYGHRSIEVGSSENGPIQKSLGQWWLNHPGRRSYEYLAFAPGRLLPADTYNLWQGFGCEARPGNCDLFLEHVRQNICGGEDPHYKYLLGWMARAIQRPGEPGQIAVVLRGGQGTGKSFFVKMFGSLFGRHYLRISDMKHLVGSFNAHLRDVVLLFADEAFYAGDRKSRGLLKSLVTDETLSIEAKGVDVEPAPNYVHLILASNDDWLVSAEYDDRRYFVLDVGEGRKSDTGYFKAIADEMAGGGREALLHWLRTYDLSEFEVRTRPLTAALCDQKMLSIDSETQWVQTLLEDGCLPNCVPKRPSVALSNDAGPGSLGLYAHARQVVPRLRDASDTRLSRILKPWGAKPWKRGSRRGWELPPLPELRTAWDKKFGPMSWDGGLEAEWRAPGGDDGAKHF